MNEHSDRTGRTDGRATRWEGQNQRRRAEFVDAALEAIASYGPDVTTHQIAQQAGVARTRLYKHFADAADLRRSIAQRAGELLAHELEPVWTQPGPPSARIAEGVRTHLRWLADHANLYRYLGRHTLAPDRDRDAITDIKATIGIHLSQLFESYLSAFGLDPRVAEPLGFGIVGMVEAATGRWLEDRGRMTLDELADHLADWIWRILDGTLRTAGVSLDPDEPLAVPGQARPGA